MASRKTTVLIHRFSDVRASLLDAGLPERLRAMYPSGLLDVKIDQTPIPGKSSQLPRARLLDALGALRSPVGDEWLVHVLAADSFEDTAYGLMFDDVAPAYRAGCAVFTRWIEKDFATDQAEAIAHYVAHELGHTFNLCHCDARDAISGDDVMSDRKPARFQLAIDGLGEDARRHVLEHDFETVRPGSEVPFGSGPCHAQGAMLHPRCSTGCDSAASARRGGASTSLRAELHIFPGRAFPRAGRPTYVVGEPPIIEVHIHNAGPRPVRFSRPDVHRHTLVLHRRSGDRDERLLPPLHLCGVSPDIPTDEIPAGGSIIYHQVPLLRNGGPIFPKEGRYELRAKLRVGKRWLTTSAVEVSVAPPLEPRHERIVELAADPDLAHFLEWRGPKRLGRERRKLEALLEQAPRFPLLHHAGTHLALGAKTSRSLSNLSKTLLDATAPHKGLLPPVARAEVELAEARHTMERGDVASATTTLRKISKLAKNRPAMKNEIEHLESKLAAETPKRKRR